jgi:hypothetical protein
MIPPEKLRATLPQILPWLEKTIQDRGYRFWTTEELVEALLAGRMQLWVAQEGRHYLFVVTEVMVEQTGRVVSVVLGGGSLDPEKAILQHIAGLEKWAKDIGAKAVQIHGRKAWGRLLSDHGYQHDYSTFRHTLSERYN